MTAPLGRRVAVANAPCSYGAFEITVGSDPNVPDPVALLDCVAAAGYEGIDLGPAGYLGSDAEVAVRLTERGLALAGGYLELAFSDPRRLEAELPKLDALLTTFDAVPNPPGAPPPRPTLADAGSSVRAVHPGQAALNPELGFDETGWRAFADGVAVVVARCRDAGYEPTFHPHTATHVEAMWEIERLLELTDIGICLDTGHLLVGRGDPVDAVRRWAGRLNHVHLKDARRDVLEAIVAERAPVEAIWRRSMFCPLGLGDVDVDGVIHALRDGGYEGWLVVEQDAIPPASDASAAVVIQQNENRAFLRARGI